jgi:signal peptidase II
MSSAARLLRGWVPVAAIVVAIDQLTKWWALDTLATRDIDIIWTLRLNLSFNSGMAFGQGAGYGPVIAVLAPLVIIALVMSVRHESSRLADVAVGLVVGGAIGNLLDRMFRDDAWLRGSVVDFIDFQWFPIFNVADMGITIGGVVLVLASWRSGRRHATVEPSADPVASQQSPEP